MKHKDGLFAGRVYYPAVFLTYLGLFVAIFPDVLFAGTSFAKRDILRFYYPVWHFASSCLKDGVFPLWNPYTSYGAPFFADIQTCVLYPFSILFYGSSFLWGFNFYILIHLTLAGFFTCLWMRDCGASREAAFLSGFSFALSGYTMSAINLTISLASLIYFPLFLLCLRRVFHGKGFLWSAAGSVVLVFQYLAGDPAVLFATLVIGSLFTAFKTIEVSVRARRLSLWFFWRFSAMVDIFLGLSAFHILLFVEFLHHSNRAVPTFDTMTIWSLQYNDLIGFFVPYFSDISLFFMDYWARQSWLDNCYAGITVFLLAFAAIRYRRTNMTGYLVLMALFGLMLALGRFSYGYNVFYYCFPFFKYIRYPIRFVFLFHFALACLAGFGLDALLAKLDRANSSLLTDQQAKRLALLVALLAIVVVFSMFVVPWFISTIIVKVHGFMEGWSKLRWGMDQAQDMVVPVLENLKRTVLLLTFMMLGVLGVLHFKPRRVLVASFFMILAFGDLVSTNVVELRVPGSFLERVGKNMQTLIDDKTIFRAQMSPSAADFSFTPPHISSLDDILQQVLEVLSPNLLLPHHVFHSSGYDSLFMKEIVELNGQGRTISNPASYNYLNMLNLKYTVSLRETLGESYRRLQYAKPGYLYLNEKVLPRAFLVPKAELVKDPMETLKKIVSKDFEPLTQIYIDEDVPALEPAKETSLGIESTVDITQYGINDVHMRVASPSEQWLFFSDVFYPGWKAWVDGKPVKIYRANYAFRAIRVPEGRCSVRWNYDPILFKIGVSISALTALGLVLWFLGYALRRRR